MRPRELLVELPQRVHAVPSPEAIWRDHVGDIQHGATDRQSARAPAYRSLPGNFRHARPAVTSWEGAVRQLPPLRRQRVRRPAEYEVPRPLRLPAPVPRLGRRHHPPPRHQLAHVGARAWRDAAAVAYHPGGAGLTVVDLDNAEAIAWARASLPSTRGEHWIYQGVMQSANAVRPGVDVKSTMDYARWRGPGTGTVTALPDGVRALAVKMVPTACPTPHAITVPARAGGVECRHRTPVYLDRGIAMAEQRITEAPSAVHTTVYRTFLAVLSAHGRCGCLTDTHVARLLAAAQAKGESPRHCTDAWTNARTRLGL